MRPDWSSTLLQATLFRFLVMGLVAIAVFRVAQPYAFGGSSVLDFSLASKWLDNMREISRTMKLEVEMPPTHQWANRTPFVFPFVNMVVWGMGLPLGLAAWAGWLVATWQVLRALTLGKGVAAARPHILPVAWIGGMFLWQGMQAVVSMRYLLPLYPSLAMMAAWFLWWLVEKASASVGDWKLGAVQLAHPTPPRFQLPAYRTRPTRSWPASPSSPCCGAGGSWRSTADR